MVSVRAVRGPCWQGRGYVMVTGQAQVRVCGRALLRTAQTGLSPAVVGTDRLGDARRARPVNR